MRNPEFNQLFILDLANNHQGDLSHAKNIITEMGRVVKETGVEAAVKFQFRHLETFIHPDFKTRQDVPHIPRFMSTALSKEDYSELVKTARRSGLRCMATPFDEESVRWIRDLGIDYIKVASCSALDRPLLECIAREALPVVVSTGGLNMNQIDRLVSFLEFHRMQFALMHCVAVYPTVRSRLNMNQITLLRERFPTVPVGFSTHEEPENLDAVRIAFAKGAKLFERHVGIQTEKHKLNAYSSTPEQVRARIDACLDARAICGGEERAPAPVDEKKSLQSLMRGVYAKRDLQKGRLVKRDDVFFAMPLQDSQLNSGQWFDGIVADRDYSVNQALEVRLAKHETPPHELIYRIMLQVKGMLNQARIYIGKDSSIEISHHYGLERFREFGCVIINCINRDYCKKLIVQLPRQKHPYHYHEQKEETFQLLYGDLEVEADGHRTRLQLGDTFLVAPGVWHKFHTLDGAIFEEVSTTHYNTDSFYEDASISSRPREARKTAIPNWETAVSESM